MATATYLKKIFGLLTFAAFILISNFAMAAPKNPVASGPWATPGTWNGGTVPVAGDVVTISGGFTVTIGANVTAANGPSSVTINGGSTLAIGNNFKLNTQNVAGVAIINNGTLSIGTGTSGITWTNGGSFVNNGTVSGGVAANTATFTLTAGALAISGTTAFTIPCIVVTAGTLTNNLNVGTGITLIGGTTPLTGAGTFSNSGVFTLGTGGANTASTITTFTNNATGVVNVNSTTLTAFNPGTLNSNSVGNTVNYTCAAPQTVKLPAAGTYYNLGLSGSGAKGVAAGITTVLGTLTMGGTATCAPAAGGFANIGTTATAGTGLVMNGTSNVCTLTLPAITNFNRDITINNTTAGVLIAQNFVHVIKGNFTNNGTTANFTQTAGGAFTFNGAVAQSIAGTGATTFLTINCNNTVGVTNNNTNALTGITVSTSLTSNAAGGGTFINASGSILNVSGTVTNVAGDLLNVTNNGTATVSGAVSNTGTITNAASALLNIASAAATFNPTTFTASAANNTVNWNTGAQAVKSPTANTYYNLTLSTVAAGTKTMPAVTMIISGNFTISGAASATAAGILQVAKNFIVNTTGIFTNGNFTHTVAGNWIHNGAAAAYAAGGTAGINFNGTVAQTIGDLVGPPATNIATNFNNVTISNTSAVVTLNFNENIAGTLTINNNAQLAASPSTIQINTAGPGASIITGVGPVPGLGTLFVNRAGSPTGDLLMQYRFSAYNLNNIRVNYSGTLAQNINGAASLPPTTALANYGALTTSGNNTCTLLENTSLVTGALTSAINGVTINNGSTLNGASFDLTLAGDWQNDGTFTPSTGRVIFASTATGQTIKGTTNPSTFFNLRSNNSFVGGGITLNDNITIAGTLDFVAGRINTGANKVTVNNGTAGAISGPGAGKYVNGVLERFINSTLAYTFAIGDAAGNYTPAILTPSVVATTGLITASVTPATYAPFPSTDISPANYINRYWTLGNATADATYSLQLNWIAPGDQQGTATASSVFPVVVPTLGPLAYPVVTSTLAGQITMGPIAVSSGMGDYVLGEQQPLSISNTTGASITQCSGTALSFTSSAVGYNPTSYIWTKLGTGTVGNAATYPIASLVPGDAGTYTVSVTNSAGATASAAVLTNLVVESPVVFTTQPPAAAAVCVGNTANLGSVSTGSVSAYQWYDISGSPVLPVAGEVSGETTATLTVVPTVAYVGTASYYVVVTAGTCGNSTSNISVLTVNPNPTPTLTPMSTTSFCNGGYVQLDVNVAPAPSPSYIWSPGGSTTSSATGNTNAVYAVTVTDGNMCTATASQAVTVYANPTPTLTPVSTTSFCNGGYVQLDVDATPAPSPSYIWSPGGSTTASATGNTNAFYAVTVTDANMCTATASQAVTVYPNPTPTLTPLTSTSFCNGGYVQLDVDVTPAPSPSYIWSPGGSTTSSATGNTNGIYRVTITDANLCTATASQAVTVYSNPIPNISAGGPTSFCSGDQVVLTASLAVPVPSPSYIWSPGGSTTTTETGNTTATYIVTVTDANTCTGTASLAVNVITPVMPVITPSGATSFCAGGSVTLDIFTANLVGYNWGNGNTTSSLIASTGGVYSVTTTDVNTCTATTSQSVTVLPNTNITTALPATMATCQGSTQTFEIAATGAAPLGYTWYFNGSSLSDGTNGNGNTISGSTTATLVVTNMFPVNQGTYTVEVSSNCGSNQSSSTVLSIDIPPGGGTLNTINQCEGTNAALFTSITGSGTLNYYWFKGATFTGVTTPTYTFSPLQNTDNGTYSVSITGVCSPPAVISTTVTVNALPTLTPLSPLSQNICQNNDANFSVNSNGLLQWSKAGTGVLVDNGTKINGAQSTTLTIFNIDPTDNGTYVVVATSAASCTSSASLELLVGTQPVAPNSIPDVAPCVGTTATITVPGYNAAFNYQWLRNGAVMVNNPPHITGTTTGTLTIDNVGAADVDIYSVQVTSSSCGGPPATVPAGGESHLSLSTPIVINAFTTDTVICETQNGLLYVDVSGTSPVYTWTKSGSGTVGSNSSVLSLPSFSNNDVGVYSVSVTGTCTPAGLSTPATNVGIRALPRISAIGDLKDASACDQQPQAQLFVSATGYSLTYLWRKNGVSTSAPSSPTYTISPVTQPDSGKYDVIVTNGCGYTTSSRVATFSVDKAPQIVADLKSTDQTCKGGNYTFSVGATGDRLKYQWFHYNTNVNLFEARSVLITPSTYTIFPVEEGDKGLWHVVVSNPGCPTKSVQSQDLDLTAYDGAIGGKLLVEGKGGSTIESCLMLGSGKLNLTTPHSTVDGWESSQDTITWTPLNYTADNYDFASHNVSQSTYFRVNVSNGICKSKSELAYVKIDPQTVPGAIAASATGCYGSNGSTLHLSGNVGNINRWEILDANGNTWVTIQNNTPDYTYSNLLKTTQFRAVVQSGVCLETPSQPVTITIVPNVFNAEIEGGRSVCENINNGKVRLIGFNGVVKKWEYSKNHGATWDSIPVTDTTLLYSNLTSATRYRAVVIANSLCPAIPTPYVDIQMSPRPNVDFELPSAPTANAPLNFGNRTTISEGTISFFSWNFGDGENSSLRDPSHTYASSGNYNVVLTAVSENGCKDSLVKVLDLGVTDEFFVSNVLTLNGNGQNEVWYVEGLEKFVVADLTIFNRYGGQIYHTSQYKNDWAGTYNGKKLPDGTYYYLLKIETDKGEKITRKGSITILN